jgi:uncharacterized membrane protein
MSDADQLIVYTFDGAGRAEEARAAIAALEARRDPAAIGNVAVVSKAADGALSFWETAEADELRRDADIYSLAGWLLGAVGAVLGAPLGPRQGVDAGAGVGGAVAERVDTGFRDEDLRHFGEQLVSGSSAVIVLVRRDEAAAVIAELEALGGTLAQTTLPAETVHRLRAARGQ